MLSDLLWLIVLCTFCLFGLKRPYIALTAVIFVDILKPQNLSFSFLAGKPLSFIMTLVFILSLLLTKHGWKVPEKKLPSILLILLMIWITITTQYAEYQWSAWYKHDYSFKTILFAFFIPFVINSRHKVDFFIAVMVSAIAYFTINGGMKTLFGVTGYGMDLVYSGSNNSGIAESSTLSMVSAFVLPFIYYLYRYAPFNRNKLISVILIAISLSAVFTIIGTHARTGLIGLFVLFVAITLKTKHKLKIFSFGVVMASLVFTLAPQNWLDRMNTISSAKTESSAAGRLVVWKWTIDYVSSKPILGGGFTSHQANAGQLHLYMEDSQSITVSKKGKAFHNIYFEVLGEHGYVGLFIFLMIIYTAWRSAVNAQAKMLDSEWVAPLAQLTIYGLLVFCACGMFIGIAFSPWLYYFLGLSGSLNSISLKNDTI